jgi:drug/metabolite transporter (DMT)-like permease
MYHLSLSVLLKIFDPYYRRHIISNTLNAKDYIYLESFIYFFILIIFILFDYFYDKKQIIETFNNYKNIKIRDIIILICITIFWVYTSIKLYENEHKNTAFMNSVILRGAPLIGILLVGILIYEEKYTWKQIVGIFFTIIGIFLLMLGKNK